MKANKGQFKKGVSGNPNGAPKKGKPSVFSASIVQPSEEKKTGGVSSRDEWIPFGDNNLYPQGVAILGRRSAVHRSILKYKTIYIAGSDVSSENDKTNEYFLKVNGNGESQGDVFGKIAYDYNSGGNAYLELVKDDEELSMAQFHKDWTTARVKKTTSEDSQKAILFHPNWSDVRRTKKDIVEIPLYPDFKKVNGKLRSVIHFKEYEPEFKFYGLSSWIGAQDSAGIAYKTNKWNISRLDNSFSSSGVLVVEGDMSPEDAAQLQADFQANFTGEGNQGKVMLVLKSLGGGETKFTPTSSTSDGEWLSLHEQAQNELIVAHLWKKSLAGLDQNTGFETERARADYNLVHAAVVTSVRKAIIPRIAFAINKELGLDTETMAVVNLPPPSLLDSINPELYTFTWEARQAAGMEADPEDEALQGYVINNQKKEQKDGAANKS